MRRASVLFLGLTVMTPISSWAGQLYGSIVETGKGVPKASIEVNCAGAKTTGTTADDGSYRVFVKQQGRCTFSLPSYPGYPSADVFSYSEPAQYDFELVNRGDGKYGLRRR